MGYDVSFGFGVIFGVCIGAIVLLNLNLLLI